MRYRFIKNIHRRGRRYPIKRDRFGESARRCTFRLFDEGIMPAEAARRVGISSRTARRYFQQWKKILRCLEEKYRLVQRMMREAPGFSEQSIKYVAGILQLPEAEVRARFEAPWGTKRLLMGRWRAKDTSVEIEERNREWERLKTALRLIDLVEFMGIPQGIIV